MIRPAISLYAHRRPRLSKNDLASRHVLIVSTAVDLSTDAVVRALGERNVRVTRWNTEDYPFRSRLTSLLTGSDVGGRLVRQSESSVDFSTITAVWYRRVRTPERPDAMDPGIFDFCLRESRASLIGGLLGTCPRHARWMSLPSAVWNAEHKVYQLAVARECGFKIPDTVVTNDPAEARIAFMRFDGHMIAKPVRTGYVEVEGDPYSIFTSAVTPDDVNDLERGVRPCHLPAANSKALRRSSNRRR